MTSKKILTATAVLATVFVSMSAQAEEPKVATPYIEGQLGYAKIDNMNTNTYTGSVGGLTGNNLNGRLDYDSNATYGIEIGLKDVLMPNLRIGASFATMKLDLNSAEINGIVTNGTTTYTGPMNVSGAQLASIGANFNHRANLYMANAYYDFKTFSNVTPFIGMGAGFSDIKNTKDLEFAYDFNAGAKYNINKNTYIGIKGAYTRINGPTENFGVKLHDIEVYSANAAIGLEF